MAKQTGLGDNLYVAGYDLSGDVGSLGRIGGGPAAREVTGIDKSAFERKGGLRDGSIEYSAWFNPDSVAAGDATDQLHTVLSALPTADQILSYCRGTSLDSPAACLVSKQLNYDGNRSTDGDLTFAITAEANSYGIEWGRQLTAGLRSDTAATDGSSIDTGASAAFGLQAYLQVVSFTGTDATITIEDSADDATFAAVTGGAFTQVTTAPTAERIQTGRTQTVRRYLRVATSTTGGFSELTFSVVVVKNDTEVLF